MSLASTSAAAIVLSLVTPAARAQCPDWSDAFAPGGLNGRVAAFEVHDSGNGPELFAGGVFDRGIEETGSVARWNGSGWESIGAPLEGVVEALEVFDSGQGPRLFAAGDDLFGDGTAKVAVWDGATWSPVAGSPSGAGSVLALESFAGSLYAGGDVSFDGTPGIARWDGAQWIGFGGVLGGNVRALEVHDDGSGEALYVGGSFAWAGGIPARLCARWDGATWSAVGTIGSIGGLVNALAVHDFGSGNELVVAGQLAFFPGGTGGLAARWNGTAWTNLPGLFTEPDSSGFPAGSTLLSRDAGGVPELLIGCVATGVSIPGVAGNAARWTGSAWAPIGSGLPQTSVEALVEHDDGSGTRLFAGGTIRVAGASIVQNVARWDGSDWQPAGEGQGVGSAAHAERVLSIATFDDGAGERLFVAGSFQGAGNELLGSLVSWDGASWSSAGAPNGQVTELCTFDDGGGPQLYAAGAFTTIGGVSAMRIARWNGIAWSALPGPPLAPESVVKSLVVHDDGSGPALYAAGWIVVPGQARGLAARWRDGAWSRVGDPVPECNTVAELQGLAVHVEDGVERLFGCGASLPSGSCHFLTWFTGVLRWDGAGWSQLGGAFLMADGAQPRLWAITSHDEGGGPVLYAAGEHFGLAADPQTYYVARWIGGSWSGLVGPDAEVLALASFDDGRGEGPALVAGGQFSNVGATPAPHLARWRAGTWSELSGGVDAPTGPVEVAALHVASTANGRSLYAGGRLQSAGTQGAGNLARYDACDETGRTYCYGDGSATACPCGNASAVGDRAGCLHSLGSGGTLRARGEPSLTSDSLSIDGASMPNSSALYFQGLSMTAGGSGVTFGDGIKCTNGPFVRLLTKVNASGASTFPEAGDPSVSAKGLISGPGTRHYQVRYRNSAAFCSSETFNYTNAIEVVWRL